MNGFNPWVWFGSGAAIALLGSAWSYIRTAAMFLRSQVIVTDEIHGLLDDAILLYCNRKFTASKFGNRTFFGCLMFLGNVQRQHLIAAEDIGSFGKLYWDGWVPIWVKRKSRYQQQNTSSIGRDDNVMTITYARGTIDADRIIADAADMHSNECQDSISTRHRIKFISGTAGQEFVQHGVNAGMIGPPSSVQSEELPERLRNARILRYTWSDLRPYQDRGQSLKNVAMPDTVIPAIEELQRWHSSEKWYRSRGVPWRISWLLSGPPGNGKTSTARALSEWLDLPVFVFDLATLRNRELQSEWTEMLSHVPCMAVMEDLHATFDGSTSLVDGGLSFPCLLNCIDGISRSDGVFLVMTTNKMENVDPALSRKGRADRHIVFPNPDESARRKIAARILCDTPELIDATVADGVQDSGADFQDRCTQLALSRFMEV